ncbi:hypothetical protein BO86DRAFT_411846 [Aspergillus japonicus CBS 114.51]|uniref:Asl1-like glycosyl hydrolase catalytic domain-containing protein n=2 Tax=Aspergillus TaxID=5052 RepID=A0A2V5GYM1_ASPV1|nr:hypothetical protein BO86DRAFT_411846 [Aspergillus japonicus CBS 114.51]PYI13423.1 hypothetical protein BO99DRAFT_407526 [Aspergillus violaceofuscus CBS 115571]RAH79120.1 hypothetical protein BO86DRAFT_411846 [Aspergillus japonicus CBS 114.51]
MPSFAHILTAGLVATSAVAFPVQSRRTSLQKRSTGKRGAAYNDATLVSTLTTDEAGTVSWSYNWGSSMGGDMPSNVEYVPMLWGSGSDYVDGWTDAVETALSSGSSYILGFNEPDMSSQADMTAATAAELYAEYITPYANSAKLVSPAVTSSTSSGEGLDWFKSFMSDCSSCNISALAVHWYGDSVDELKTFVNEAIEAAAEYDISEVWLTEFGLSADTSGVSDTDTTVSFLDEAVSWLDSQSSVTRYAFFYCANNYMFTDDAVNSVGDVYVSSSSSSTSTSTSSSSASSTSSSASSASSSAASSSSSYESSSSSESSFSASSSSSSESSSSDSFTFGVDSKIALLPPVQHSN